MRIVSLFTQSPSKIHIAFFEDWQDFTYCDVCAYNGHKFCRVCKQRNVKCDNKILEDYCNEVLRS